MSAQTYFDGLAAQERRLSEHGFDHYPTDEELLEYLMQLNDKVNALYRATGMDAVQDWRGNWHAHPARREAV